MLARVWRALTSRPVLAVAFLGAGLVLAGEIRWKIEETASSSARAARPTRRFERWRQVELEAALRVPSPPADDLADARRRWNRPDLVSPEAPGGPVSPDLPATQPGGPATPGETLIDGQVRRAGAILLAEAEDRRPAPAGVEVAAVLEADGRTTLIVKPRPVPLLRFPLKWRADGWVDPLSGDFDAGVTFRALRVGRWELGPGVRGGMVDGQGQARLVLAASFDF